MEAVDGENENGSKWTIGGPPGTRGTVLAFKCSALSNPPTVPPGDLLHMTYKTQQTETKLLTAMLASHGLKEVSEYFLDLKCSA